LFNAPSCLLSIDVEDWFHLIGAGLDYQFIGQTGGVESWGKYSSRVEQNTNWILDKLDEHEVKGTFFILGWVAERFPGLVAEISKRGHEVGSHSYWHKLIPSQTPDQFRTDLRRSLEVIQSIIGVHVLGFRASSASITDWATDIIGEEGLVYDSSLFPASYHDVYGRLKGVSADKPIERLGNGLLEVKLSSLTLFNRQFPWSGGGYFRFLPYKVFSIGVRQIIQQKGFFHFYIHPWELDDNPPKLKNLKPFYYYRRYVSIRRPRSRFQTLLKDFHFRPIIDAVHDFEKSGG
jgi:polysaccharide deacetylase family protein (PEP-CTERM system associated)